MEQFGEKISKRADYQVLYDDDLASAMPISNDQLHKNIDDIVIEMVIHCPKLTDQESWMLKIS